MATYYAVTVATDGTVSDLFSMAQTTMSRDEASAYLLDWIKANAARPFNGEPRMLVPSEYKRLVWVRDWNILTAAERELYTILWPRLASSEFDPGSSKSVDQLKGVAHHRLHKLGLSETCSRCGGTGMHSSCERFGTTCFKCGSAAKKGVPGCGYQMPKITRKLIASAVERMAKATLSETGEILKVED